MLEWICPLRSTTSHGEGAEDTCFTNTERNKFVEKFQHLEELHNHSPLKARPHIGKCKNLNAMEVIGSRVVGSTWLHGSTKGKVGVVTTVDQRIKAAIRIVQPSYTYGVG